MKVRREQLRQLLTGAAFFSTGGGGSLAAGLELIADIDELEILDVNSVDPAQICATAYLVGSISAPPLSELKAKNGDVAIENESDLVTHAFNLLCERFPGGIDLIIPVELGGHNTAVSLYLAAKAKLPLLDADLTGRSAPEMYQTAYYTGDITPSPAGIFTPFGEKLYVENVHDYKRFDDFLRALVSLCYGSDVGVANFPVPVATAKRYLIKNSLTRCIEVGSLLNRGKIEEAIALAEGKIIFRGQAIEEEYEVRNGFTYGHVLVKNEMGILRLEYMNEILAAFLNNHLVAVVPELIGVVTTNGRPVLNTEFKKGENVIVFTVPAPAIWQSAGGLSVFGPEHFGYSRK